MSCVIDEGFPVFVSTTSPPFHWPDKFWTDNKDDVYAILSAIVGNLKPHSGVLVLDKSNEYNVAGDLKRASSMRVDYYTSASQSVHVSIYCSRRPVERVFGKNHSII